MNYPDDQFQTLEETYDKAVARSLVPDILGQSATPQNAAPNAYKAPAQPQAPAGAVAAPATTAPPEASQVATQASVAQLFGGKIPFGYLSRRGRPAGAEVSQLPDLNGLIESIGGTDRRAGKPGMTGNIDPDMLDKIAAYLVNLTNGGGF